MNEPSRYTLEICAESPEVKAFYESRANYEDDAGVDLYVPNTITIGKGGATLVGHGIKCRMIDELKRCNVSYYLYARSSIAKTPLMLANSVGIIDKNYRGEIKAALRYIPEESQDSYTIEKGTRLVQICAPDLSPLKIRFNEDLDITSRGVGGFGSTGK